ncbi:MAG TPA: AbrB/MazE/SpoVT family DNA-binding domain-containing protein [Candidatus Competibacter sp.]|nr:AbrB family transcriptional regulator [Candidatus Competibacteraceae bacterium]HUM95592.1 AbrB/MazE/SpoVT family DNA-binding domain-containing protein [Candidatus Competibacter sp.]
MTTVTVSEKGQVVIPASIRRRLGIIPGCQLDFTLEGDTIQVIVKRPVKPAQAEEGYGLLVCNKPGKRCLDDFDVARAMRENANDSA